MESDPDEQQKTWTDKTLRLLNNGGSSPSRRDHEGRSEGAGGSSSPKQLGAPDLFFPPADKIGGGSLQHAVAGGLLVKENGEVLLRTSPRAAGSSRVRRGSNVARGGKLSPRRTSSSSPHDELASTLQVLTSSTGPRGGPAHQLNFQNATLRDRIITGSPENSQEQLGPGAPPPVAAPLAAMSSTGTRWRNGGGGLTTNGAGGTSGVHHGALPPAGPSVPVMSSATSDGSASRGWPGVPRQPGAGVVLLKPVREGGDGDHHARRRAAPLLNSNSAGGSGEDSWQDHERPISQEDMRDFEPCSSDEAPFGDEDDLARPNSMHNFRDYLDGVTTGHLVPINPRGHPHSQSTEDMTPISRAMVEHTHVFATFSLHSSTISSGAPLLWGVSSMIRNATSRTYNIKTRLSRLGGSWSGLGG